MHNSFMILENVEVIECGRSSMYVFPKRCKPYRLVLVSEISGSVTLNCTKVHLFSTFAALALAFNRWSKRGDQIEYTLPMATAGNRT